MRFCSPLRYPGGKTFLAPEFERIIEKIGLENPIYIEPYAGGAGAALALLFTNKVNRIVINDLDVTIYAFWRSVVNNSEKFIKKIRTTPITIYEREKQKKIYLSKNSKIFDRGFATFFLNRTNRSGVLNAGPMGGYNQAGNYKIDARYNKRDLIKRIRKIGKYKDRIKVKNEEGISLTKKYINKPNTFIYLDPPYFKKGVMLYMNHYSELEHEKLARLLNRYPNQNWILTYDEVLKVRNLYKKRNRKRLTLNYRVYDSNKPRLARELMIFSDSVRV